MTIRNTLADKGKLIASPIGEPIIIYDQCIKAATELAKAQGHERVLAIVVATKPCFYKLWGIMAEASRQELPFFVLHTGQHYDDVVGYGFSEFGFNQHLGIDMQLRGDLCQKTAEFYVKTKLIACYFKERFSKVLVVPYVNGDTVTTAHFSGAWLFATNRNCIQGEAGLRSMSPQQFEKLLPTSSPEQIIEMQWGKEWKKKGSFDIHTNWMVNRTEPFPEQYDTFVGGAACDYFFAPVELNAEHLKREGYDPEHIFVCGNTVVDAIKAKRAERALKTKNSVFELYPKLANGSWLRVDIHRRENLTRRRFHAIINAVIGLVEQNYNVAFIELTAVRRALEHYGLRNKLLELANRKNFLFTPVWKEYTHVMEFLESGHCWAILTDSGGMQEEMNELGKPCMTARFSTDRPETILARSNLLIPPLDSQQIIETVRYVNVSEQLRETMQGAKKLYSANGNSVSSHIVAKIKVLFKKKDPFFSWAHDRLKLYHEDEFFEYL